MKLEHWNDFKAHCHKNYFQSFYRHLYCERDSKFVEKSRFFVQKLMEEPRLECSKTAAEVVYRLYRPAEMIAKYFKQVEIIPTTKTSFASISNTESDQKIL